MNRPLAAIQLPSTRTAMEVYGSLAGWQAEDSASTTSPWPSTDSPDSFNYSCSAAAPSRRRTDQELPEQVISGRSVTVWHLEGNCHF